MLSRCSVSGLTELRQELLDHVLDAFDEAGALLEQAVTATGLSGQWAARHGKDLAILLEGHPRGYQRAALLGGLDDNHAERHPRDHPVASGKILRDRRGAHRQFRDERAAALDNQLGEPAMLRRIDDVHAA